MKKTLLALALLGFATGRAAGQTTTLNGPWVEVNTVGFATPPGFEVSDLVVLSPTFAWGLGYGGSSSHFFKHSIRVSNSAGTAFGYLPINGAPGLQPYSLTVPAGLPGNLVAFCSQISTGSGDGNAIIRTADGGVTWRRISNNNTFSLPAGFITWVHAFDADHVTAGGDPNPVPAGGGGGTFEFQYTSNASAQPASAVVWTRATVVPPALSIDEYLEPDGYAAVGNTIWAATVQINGAGTVVTPSRILRSTDQGHTWTVASTPTANATVIERLAFKDALHGVALATSATATEVVTTADGGLSWTRQTPPNPLTADTLLGKLYRGGVVAVSGVGFVSFGAARPRTGVRADHGASFSPDGVGRSWRDIDKGHALYTSAAFVACGAGGYQGYLGSRTDASGRGGLFQVGPGCAALPLATRPGGAAAGAINVAPNPSTTGRFVLSWPQGLPAGGTVNVFDALGRQVLARPLAASPAAGSAALELPRAVPGVYVLRLLTPSGASTHKLLVD